MDDRRCMLYIKLNFVQPCKTPPLVSISGSSFFFFHTILFKIPFPSHYTPHTYLPTYTPGPTPKMADTTEKYDLANTTTNGSSPLQQTQTKPASAPYENGHYGPLAHVNTAEYRLPAFGGEFQPGLYRSPKNRKIGNPAPLGLCAFALTTFILGCIQMQVRGITQPNIIVGSAFGYGGLVQLLAGMWYV